MILKGTSQARARPPLLGQAVRLPSANPSLISRTGVPDAYKVY